MSAASLPGYPAPPTHLHSPTYTAVPRAHEHRLALNARLRPNRPLREFVKQTKNGGVSLRLVGQDDQATLPVYGLGASVQGTVEINKTDGITSVEVLIEGTLRLEEVAEGGTANHRLCLSKSMLWVKDRIQDAPCPSSLRFSLTLPTTFSDGDKTYPLPPSFEAHLSGLPGFRANIDYSVTAVAIKPNVQSLVKSTLFRKDDWAVSTPIMYLPRTRPSVPIPAPLTANASCGGFVETPQWKMFSSTATTKQRGVRDLVAKLYLPATRIFCVRQPIPFYLSFHSNAASLAAFLPFAPVAGLLSPKRQLTRIQLMRQTTVDVRNAMVLGTKTDIWRVDCIGEGAFKYAEDGPGWTAFSGEIFIGNHITIGGFRAGGFSVRDCLVLTMTPPELVKSPFKELRLVVPIRLATDPWNEDGSGLGAYGGVYDPPSMSSSEELLTPPELLYHG
ncbi:hypothetical protein PAXINDRAFT_167632 [Paxillus involutus ATCC 200175]|nr:hypothetical protein PAXINDRAFT_167632 [Paxillus involutus ATCC 200175]